MSWERAWREGRTGWDAGAPNPTLLRLVESGEIPHDARVLVPGCGAGYDAHALAAPGREVVGLDMAPTAAERFEARRRELGLPVEQVRVETADFFAFDPDEPFDVIWDYTFLCAIHPSQREVWARRMDALLAEAGELLTLVFPTQWVKADRSTPPFRLTPEDVRSLLEPRGFAATTLEPVPAERSHEGRGGLEWLGRWRRI